MGVDILFVNPNAKKANYGTLASEFAGIEPPIWCGLKAAYVRNKGHLVNIIDAEAENLSPLDTTKLIAKEEPKLVDIVVMGINPSASSTPKMQAVEEIIDELYNIDPEINVILSGIHPSALPEQTIKQKGVDFICQGEGFDTITKLIETIKSGENNYKINGLWYKQNGKIFSNPPSNIIKDIDELPFVAWDLLPMEKYRAHNWHCLHDLNGRKPYAAIYTSLGCPFNCTYCNIHCIYDGKPGIRYRSPKLVVDELELLNKKYKVKNIKILDELFVLKEDRVNEICDLIIERNLDFNIWAYSRIDTVNKNILIKMKKAGINWLCFGIEAGSHEVRKNVQKGRFNQDTVKSVIQMTHDAGVHIIGNFMFGLPEDTIETMQETLNLAKELNCEYVNFYSVMAYPGSKLFEEVKEKGDRLPDSWLGYAQLSKETIPLPNKYLTSEEILKFRDKAFDEYYNDSNYLEMIDEKFGKDAVNHIKKMLTHKLQRNILHC
jgi:radical SAM superfamily enzyme YgiQ (UPF0313 family)